MLGDPSVESQRGVQMGEGVLYEESVETDEATSGVCAAEGGGERHAETVVQGRGGSEEGGRWGVGGLFCGYSPIR